MQAIRQKVRVFNPFYTSGEVCTVFTYTMEQDLKTLVAHYTDASEQTRLNSPGGQLELQRTVALLKQYLPPAPAMILDVGGGAGVYSLWLAEQGYNVHLIDPVPKHVEQALEASRLAKHPIESASVGDARSLGQSDQTFDAVLLLGPLYHLLDEPDRIQAIGEAHRVLRPSGLVFAAAISRFTSALDGLWRKLLDDPEFVPIVQRDLIDGRHRNPTNNTEYFTDAFLHLPDELQSEVQAAGFKIESLCAVEGPAWLLPDLAAWLSDQKRHDLLMGILGQIANHENLIGASAHLIAVGRRMADRPSVSLQLKRCELRNWCRDDIASLVENANDKEVWSNLRDAFPHPYTIANAIEWVATVSTNEPVTHLAIAVDGHAVGGISLTLQGDISRKSAEIGYWLGRRHWGKGIMTEAVTAFTQYGFKTFDLCRIFAVPLEGSIASTKVLEKAGYNYEGKMRKAAIKEGKILDQLLYAAVRE
jgi:RimJ/RimL family protein N-acetyltransferase/ubiquinone/menaquinone biosynthesis C-methylase UbiE